MALIDTRFVSLAGPPSLDSCTRDIYAPDVRFDVPSALGIALAMARVGVHLHERGLMHGDLYGHNILHNHQGHALLGDFGAASFYGPPEQPRALALQRIEVRAFGCLLQELLEHCPGVAESPAMFEALTSLTDLCLSTNFLQRPLFAEIENALLTWTAPASRGTDPV
jgi:serine/threonine protein kinase